MSSREKDQADFDLEKFVDLFDTAMSSDNPTVQRALRNLLMIAAMVDAENTDNAVRQGPLRRLVEDIKHLNNRLNNVENLQRQPYTTPTPYTPGGIPGSVPAVGTWPNTYPYPHTTTTTTPGTFPPNTIVGGGTSVSTGYVRNSGAVSGTFGIVADDYNYNALLDKLETK